MKKSTSLLKVDQLCIPNPEQPEKWLLDHISFELQKGEILALVGESGSGKSLIAKSIMGILPKPLDIKKGRILFNPQQDGTPDDLMDSEMVANHRGKSIGMVFQEPMSALNPLMTCGKQVTEALQYHYNIPPKLAREKALSLFEKVALKDPKRSFEAYPHELSGGQKQRVMIAAALINEPTFLIADEPTTALDKQVQHGILTLLKDLQKSLKITILLVSHDLGAVKSIADEVLVIYKGVIQEKAPANDLPHRAQSAYTKGLWACKPVTNKRFKSLPGLKDFLENSPKAKAYEDGRLLWNEEEWQAKNEQIQAQIPLLEIKDLYKSFPKKKNFWGKITQVSPIFEGLNLKLYPGECLGLTGTSGSGKSTLLRCINGLSEVQGGSITFEQKPILQLGAKALRQYRKKVQLVFQNPYGALNPQQKIGTILGEPLKAHTKLKDNSITKKCLELLHEVDLPESFFDRYPHELSGGQRQRINIARALILSPKIILFDESVAALDVSVQSQILNLINQLKEKFGFSAIFVSHDDAVIHFIADRKVHLSNGQLQEVTEASPYP